jgi:TIR domain
VSYEIFISHASEDKEAFVRPLAAWLTQRGVKVWYDEYVLVPGDSIRDKINEGLRVCRYGLVVLSPRFYSKSWPQRELNSLFSLITSTTDRRLIPVLLDMSFRELGAKDPLLIDIKGVSAEVGVEAVGRDVIQAMVRDEEDRRHSGATRYRHSSYAHNYYRPPEDVPSYGYRFARPYEFGLLEAALRPREILMAFLPDDGRKGFNAACHITCLERLRDLQRDWPALEVLAVDIDKLKGLFDEPFSPEQLASIRNGG